MILQETQIRDYLMEKMNSGNMPEELVEILANAPFWKSKTSQRIAKVTVFFLLGIDKKYDNKALELFSKILRDHRERRALYDVTGMRVHTSYKGRFRRVNRVEYLLDVADFLLKRPYISKSKVILHLHRKFLVEPQLPQLSFTKKRILDIITSSYFLDRMKIFYDLSIEDLNLFISYVDACNFLWSKLRYPRHVNTNMLSFLAKKIDLPQEVIARILGEFFNYLSKSDESLLYVKNWKLLRFDRGKTAFTLYVQKNQNYDGGKG